MVRAAAAIVLEPGAFPQFETLLTERFVPAVSRYPGFREVWLLQSKSNPDAVELNVVFDTEEERLTWVASNDHDVAWAPLGECCLDVQIGRFDVVVRAVAT
jgi:heme-degrading monooxygenase HmoA